MSHQSVLIPHNSKPTTPATHKFSPSGVSALSKSSISSRESSSSQSLSAPRFSYSGLVVPSFKREASCLNASLQLLHLHFEVKTGLEIARYPSLLSSVLRFSSLVFCFLFPQKKHSNGFCNLCVIFQGTSESVPRFAVGFSRLGASGTLYLLSRQVNRVLYRLMRLSSCWLTNVFFSSEL